MKVTSLYSCLWCYYLFSYFNQHLVVVTVDFEYTLGRHHYAFTLAIRISYRNYRKYFTVILVALGECRDITFNRGSGHQYTYCFSDGSSKV